MEKERRTGFTPSRREREKYNTTEEGGRGGNRFLDSPLCEKGERRECGANFLKNVKKRKRTPLFYQAMKERGKIERPFSFRGNARTLNKGKGKRKI